MNWKTVCLGVAEDKQDLRIKLWMDCYTVTFSFSEMILPIVELFSDYYYQGWTGIKQWPVGSVHAWFQGVSLICVPAHRDLVLPIQPCGLIYNCCICTKHYLKRRMSLHTQKMGFIKNKLNRKICAPLRKLWPMHTDILETKGIGEKSGKGRL